MSASTLRAVKTESIPFTVILFTDVRSGGSEAFYAPFSPTADRIQWRVSVNLRLARGYRKLTC